jgi:hypothetical protein
VPGEKTDPPEAPQSTRTEGVPVELTARKRAPKKRGDDIERGRRDAASADTSPDTRESAISTGSSELLSLDLDPVDQSVSVEGEMVVADDLGEMIDVDEASADNHDPPPIADNGKRALPPPLRRG